MSIIDFSLPVATFWYFLHQIVDCRAAKLEAWLRDYSRLYCIQYKYKVSTNDFKTDYILVRWSDTEPPAIINGRLTSIQETLTSRLCPDDDIVRRSAVVEGSLFCGRVKVGSFQKR